MDGGVELITVVLEEKDILPQDVPQAINLVFKTETQSFRIGRVCPEDFLNLFLHIPFAAAMQNLCRTTVQ